MKLLIFGLIAFMSVAYANSVEEYMSEFDLYCGLRSQNLLSLDANNAGQLEFQYNEKHVAPIAGYGTFYKKQTYDFEFSGDRSIEYGMMSYIDLNLDNIIPVAYNTYITPEMKRDFEHSDLINLVMESNRVQLLIGSSKSVRDVEYKVPSRLKDGLSSEIDIDCYFVKR